jgi:serine/threonine-protein kinase OSR1/STK39
MKASFPLERSAYELQKQIGSGSTADVYVAKCLANNRMLAIKVIDLETCPIEIDTLRAEVAFWSSCNHPNVVQYYGSFIEKSTLYLLMEYMSAGSCSEIMRWGFRSGITNEAHIATILCEVLKSLAYFHENRQLHRDVKVGNILMNDTGEVKIADFGIAANLLEEGHRKRARYTVIGTPCYMAPEVLAASTGYTEKADIWSLGITAIELATGCAPYSDLHPLEVIVKITTSPPPALPEDPRFSTAMREFVRACLQTLPHKRASAAELLDMKFIKQKISKTDLAAGFLRALPPLDERFVGIHGYERKDQTDKPKPKTTEWDFGDIGHPEPPKAAPAGEAAPAPVSKKVGRFTVTSARPSAAGATSGMSAQSSGDTLVSNLIPVDVAPVAAEPVDQLAELRQQIDALTAENQKLKEQILLLVAEIKSLKERA